MKAVILAAGKGTRLGHLTKEVPKPMVSVAGKPMIDHLLQRIARAGIKDFVLVTRYLEEVIKGHLGDGSDMGLNIEYVHQADKYGTAAALLTAKERVGDETLMMTYADILTSRSNYPGALNVYKRNGGVAMTLNWVDDPWAGAACYVDENTGKMTRVIEKPPKGEVGSHYNSSGIFVFEPVIFDYLEDLKPSARGEYEIADALNKMIQDGIPIYPYYLKGNWLDIGRPEDVARAERMLDEESAADAHKA